MLLLNNSPAAVLGAQCMGPIKSIPGTYRLNGAEFWLGGQKLWFSGVMSWYVLPSVLDKATMYVRQLCIRACRRFRYELQSVCQSWLICV